MKNRRKTIMAFMLVACLIMGLGYASLTDMLDIKGWTDIAAGDVSTAFDDDVYLALLPQQTQKIARLLLMQLQKQITRLLQYPPC